MPDYDVVVVGAGIIRVETIIYGIGPERSVHSRRACAWTSSHVLSLCLINARNVGVDHYKSIVAMNEIERKYGETRASCGKVLDKETIKSAIAGYQIDQRCWRGARDGQEKAFETRCAQSSDHQGNQGPDP